MLSHYLFEADFCNPASGWEKGQVEKNVQDMRRRIWQKIPPHASLDSLNQWLTEYCQALWHEIQHPTLPLSIFEVWQQERPTLMPMGQPFDGYVEQPKRVSTTSLITFDRNRYSVPATFANRLVSLHIYPAHLEVIADNQTIAQHVRVFNRHHSPGQTLYDWRHYLSILQRKPGAIRNGEPFLELPVAFKK